MNDSGHDAESAGVSSAAARPWRERLRRPLLWGVPILMVVGALYFYLTSGRYYK